MKNRLLIICTVGILAIGCKKENTGVVVPPTVTTTPVNTIYNDGAKSGGTVTSNGGGTILDQGICWSTSPNPTISNNKVSDFQYPAQQTFTCTLFPLTSFTTYYVRAYATNSAGTSYGDQVTFSTTFTIGMQYGGGIIFSLDATGQHGLIAATADYVNLLLWTSGAMLIIGTDDADGATNTTRIIAALGNTGFYAAKICRDFRGGGFTDWFLPARYQLSLLYSKKTIVGGFSSNLSYGYWSSSEFSYNEVWKYDFSGLVNGYKTLKNEAGYVRAIRAF